MRTPENATICPQLCPVPKEDIEALDALTVVHSDLLTFWRSNGAGSYNRDSEGNRVNDLISNRLLDAEEVRELVEAATYDIVDLLAFGTPFFNTLDREFIGIAPNGEIIDLTPMGERRLVAASFDEFINRLLVDPLFYEEHLSGTGIEPDDVFRAKRVESYER